MALAEIVELAEDDYRLYCPECCSLIEDIIDEECPNSKCRSLLYLPENAIDFGFRGEQ